MLAVDCDVAYGSGSPNENVQAMFTKVPTMLHPEGSLNPWTLGLPGMTRYNLLKAQISV